MNLGQSISIRIDGELVTAKEGETIFEVAKRVQKFIPGLCQLSGVSPVGACRLCVVELASVGRMVPSCTTAAQDGMSVITRSARLDAYRQMVLELLFAEGNHVCSSCVSNRHCELQALATRLGVTHTRYNYAFRERSVDMSHPRYVLDRNRCILCTRCVRVCAEVEGARVWDVVGRGVSSRIAADLDCEWGKASSCTSCGKCVQACPTGALVEKGFAVQEMVKKPESLIKMGCNRRNLP